MEQSKNLHEGHRARIIDRFLKNPDGLQDHELLEILLFPYLPRVNTNDIAHRLLRSFGSLYGVLTADERALTSVQGVGKKVAYGIMLSGKLVEKLKTVKKPNDNAVFSFNNLSVELVKTFSGLYTEKILILLYTKQNENIIQLEYDFNSTSKTFLDKSEVAKTIALHNPAFAVIAHNHPSGTSLPSIEDDVATVKILKMFDLLGVNLVDHIIVAGNECFSYHHDGRLSKLIAEINK